VLTNENVGYTFLRIDYRQHTGCVIFDSCTENHQFVDLRHLEQKDVQTEPFRYINFLSLAMDLHMGAEIVDFGFFKRGRNQSLIHVKHQCFEFGVAQRRQ